MIGTCITHTHIYMSYTYSYISIYTYVCVVPPNQVTLEFIRLRRGESGSLLAVETAGVGVGSEMETVLTGGGRTGGSKVWDA